MSYPIAPIDDTRTVPVSKYRPYRIAVFATSTTVVGKGKRQRTKVQGYGYCGWTPVQHYVEARLPGAGSFSFPGIHAARVAAREYLALPETHQVQIRNNQDRKVWLFNKHADGRITGYMPDPVCSYY